MKNIALFTLGLLVAVVLLNKKGITGHSHFEHDEDYGDMIGDETLRHL